MDNEKLIRVVKDTVGSRVGAHGIDHLLRVRGYAIEIAEKEGARKDIVEAMALLHDLIRYEDERGRESVEETLKLAEKILKDLKAPKADIRTILDGIRSHSIHSKMMTEPTTLEAKILFEADKIDAAGRTGVARWFTAVSGNMGMPIKKAAGLYLLTIEQQRQKMGERMYTETGTDMLRGKLAYSVTFMKDLIKELEY